MEQAGQAVWVAHESAPVCGKRAAYPPAWRRHMGEGEPAGQLCRNCLYRARLVELAGSPVMLS